MERQQMYCIIWDELYETGIYLFFLPLVVISTDLVLYFQLAGCDIVMIDVPQKLWVSFSNFDTSLKMNRYRGWIFGM